jgi:RNA polymerase sigma factor (TIGR02999 family)
MPRNDDYPDDSITKMLRLISAGDADASSELFEMVYPYLKKLARARRRAWSGDHTMSSTALISEAYLKLSASSNQDWKDRAHFFRVVSRAMRQILINYREKKDTQTRYPGTPLLELDADRVAVLESASDIAALEEALQSLETKDERLVRVFECRRLAGLSIAETAAALGMSVSTVKRDSKFVDTWLRNEITGRVDEARQAS